MPSPEETDHAWRELGLAAPARRALLQSGFFTTEDLRGRTVAEIAALHGIGRNALTTLAPFLRGAERVATPPPERD